MLTHRRGRWASIKSTLVQRLVFAGKDVHTYLMYSPETHYMHTNFSLFDQKQFLSRPTEFSKKIVFLNVPVLQFGNAQAVH